MPSSATITAFYSFTANSRARASQVNSNFSIFRGHILPVDPNTQTSVNNTYDLGSSEYLWRNVYTTRLTLPADAGTTTASTGGFAIGAKGLASDFNTTASSPIANTTVTISTIGRPVEYGFIPSVDDGTASQIGVGVTSTADANFVFIYMRDGVTMASQTINYPAGSSVTRSMSLSNLKYIDRSAAGTYKYSINAYRSSGSANSGNIIRFHAYAREL